MQLGFSKNPLLDPKNPRCLRSAILKIDMTSFFSCRGWSDLDKISETGAEWHVYWGDVVESETGCRIPIWRTFGRIQWHVIPEPRITLQGSAATWWIHCHDSRATCHIAGCSHLAKSMSSSCHSAGCKNSIRHIENRFSPYFLLMQCRLWRAAAFVSSPIHLFRAQYSEYWTESEFM